MQDHSSAQNLVLSDSPAAWEALVAAARPASLLVAIEYRLSATLRSQLSPEDILQDALLIAWRDRHNCEWQGVRAFRSWLLTIVDHRISDIAAAASTLKRGGGLTRISLDHPFASGGPPPAVMISTTPSRVALYREQADTMRSALSELPDDVRDVVRLRLFDQISTEQIARELGIGMAAVRHRLRRGAEFYRRALARRMSIRSGTFP